MAAPLFCRPQAYELFRQQVPLLARTDALVRAAVAISLQELPEASAAAVEACLDRLAQMVRQRVHSNDPEAILAHLHEVLFEEQGFTGNAHDYYSPFNSYLPAVLKTRRGVPISLTLLYKAVGHRLGLRIDGINAPGHFLAAVDTGCSCMYVDPFFSGRALSIEEALERVTQTTGMPVRQDPALLRPATHAQWLARMLLNLQHIFARLGRAEDLAAMSELKALLQPAQA